MSFFFRPGDLQGFTLDEGNDEGNEEKQDIITSLIKIEYYGISKFPA